MRTDSSMATVANGTCGASDTEAVVPPRIDSKGLQWFRKGSGPRGRSSYGSSSESNTRILRILLVASAIAWGVTLPGAFAPWSWAETAMLGLGAQSIIQDPMLEYWVRMSCGVYGGVGIFFLIMAVNPHRFLTVIPITGGLMALEGVLLAFHAFRLHLSLIPCAFDASFCILVGIGLVFLGQKVRTTQESEMHES